MLTHEYLTEILFYTPWTDEWFWKINKAKRIKKGQKAGCLHPNGYWVICIDGKLYYGHILSWFYLFEEWPNNKLDHEDRIRNNNKIWNLREATESQNQWNRKKQNNNSGFKGVVWYKSRKKYLVRISKNNKSYFIGIFDDPIEGAKAYDKKAIELFGTFASLNFPK